MCSDVRQRFLFPPRLRLRTRGDFARVYGGRAVKNVGPLRVHGRPNDLPFCRLGLSVSVRVGNAVVRNAIKRRLREAFRLLQYDLPPGYDLVIIVRRHERLALADYQRLLADAAERLHRHWQHKQRSDETCSGD